MRAIGVAAPQVRDIAAQLHKEAKPDKGVKVMVPPFIDVGETIPVDVEAGRYVERAKARGRQPGGVACRKGSSVVSPCA